MAAPDAHQGVSKPRRARSGVVGATPRKKLRLLTTRSPSRSVDRDTNTTPARFRFRMSSNRAVSVALAIVVMAHGIATCGGPVPRGPARTLGLMHQNYTRAGDLRAALILGDLDGARDAARWIVENETAEWLPSGAVFHLTGLRNAARRVVAARDLRESATAGTDVAAACGTCHTDLAPAVGTRFGSGAPRTAEDLSTHMLRDSWAASRLWEGLVGPSDAAWDAGAQALAEAPLGERELGASARDVAKARSFAGQVHRTAQEATRATSLQTRKELLAEMLVACAGCHGIGSPP